MCKCNCCGHAEVLDQSEDYRREWWQRYFERQAWVDPRVSVSEVPAPRTERLGQKRDV